jgi:hypothetical protein
MAWRKCVVNDVDMHTHRGSTLLLFFTMNLLCILGHK